MDGPNDFRQASKLRSCSAPFELNLQDSGSLYLDLVRFSCGNGFEFLQKFRKVYEECAAGLIALKPVHQTDRLTAA